MNMTKSFEWLRGEDSNGGAMFCQQTKPRACAQSLASDDETKLEGEIPLLGTL